jgi:hypothetical protein
VHVCGSNCSDETGLSHSINFKWTTKCERWKMPWEKESRRQIFEFRVVRRLIFKKEILKGHFFHKKNNKHSSIRNATSIYNIYTALRRSTIKGSKLRCENSPSSLFWLCRCRYSKSKSRAATHVLMAPLVSMREKCMWPLIAVDYFCWLAICWAHDPCSWLQG